MDGIEQLRSKRRALRGHATRIINASEQDDTDVHVSLTKIDHYAKTIEILDDPIIAQLQDSFSIEEEVGECCIFMDKILSVRTRLAKNISLTVADVSRSNSVNELSVKSDKASFTQTNVSVKLPKLNIQKFSGQILEWSPFWDSYLSAIHANKSLSDVDKFNYLRGLLDGPALSVIDGLAICADNYSEAIDLLKERFDNKKAIINAHIKGLNGILPCRSIGFLQPTFDKIEKHVRGLQALGVSEETYGLIVAPIILEKLPAETQLLLSRAHGDAIYELDKLRKFIKDEIQARERAPAISFSGYNNQTAARQTFSHGFQANKGSNTMLVSAKSQLPCYFCDGQHKCIECPLSVKDRQNEAYVRKLCFNCLKANHSSKQCRCASRCRNCGKPHHTALCRGSVGRKEELNQKSELSHANSQSSQPALVTHCQQIQPLKDTEKQSINDSDDISNKNVKMHDKSSPAVHSLLLSNGSVIMQTAVATIKGKDQHYKARLLFDTASQHTFITQEAANKLGLNAVNYVNLPVSHFQSKNAKLQKFGIVHLTIICLDGTQQNISALVTPLITCQLYTTELQGKDQTYLRSFSLADPPSENARYVTIDILVGLDFYWEFVDRVVKRLPNGLVATGSSLGWMVSGALKSSNKHLTYPSCSFFISTNEDPLNIKLERLWSLDALDLIEQDFCKNNAWFHFQDTVNFKNGRYQVQFPWKSTSQLSKPLPTNRQLAIRRFDNIRKRLDKNPEFMDKYDVIIKEQLTRTFIERVPSVDLQKQTDVYYLAHHPVVKSDSATTKVRIVLDGSAKININSPSLNDCLLEGPNMIGDLWDILFRFRLRQVGISSDIEKAFLMVGLQEKDRDYTRFFWLDDYKKGYAANIVTYRFQRVPFGIVSSPFLLTATIRYHLMQNPTKTAQLMTDNIYMDNNIVSVDSESEAITYYTNAKQLMQGAGMNIREWSSNSQKLLKRLDKEDCCSTEKVKVLGLMWDTQNDTLSLKQVKPKLSGSYSKREILTSIASVFDPLGFCAPVIAKARMFMQTLWSCKLSWDDQISLEKLAYWKALQTDLHSLGKLTFSRVLLKGTIENWQLHVFADASPKAYCAVAYLRESSLSQGEIALLCSKMRCAPVKTALTLPRLELLGVLIGSRLVKQIMKAMDISKPKRIVLWTDSQIVLAWCRSGKSLPQFIANRVSEIKSSEIELRYIPSKENPADLPTRGINTNALSNSELWWKGPSWLSNSEDMWPSLSQDEGSLESMHYESALITTDHSSENHKVSLVAYKRFSSLNKLIRAVGFWARFMLKLQKKDVADRLQQKN